MTEFKVQKHTGPVEDGRLYSLIQKSDPKSHCRLRKLGLDFGFKKDNPLRVNPTSIL